MIIDEEVLQRIYGLTAKDEDNNLIIQLFANQKRDFIEFLQSVESMSLNELLIYANSTNLKFLVGIHVDSRRTSETPEELNFFQVHRKKQCGTYAISRKELLEFIKKINKYDVKVVQFALKERGEFRVPPNENIHFSEATLFYEATKHTKFTLYNYAMLYNSTVLLGGESSFRAFTISQLQLIFSYPESFYVLWKGKYSFGFDSNKDRQQWLSILSDALYGLLMAIKCELRQIAEVSCRMNYGCHAFTF